MESPKKWEKIVDDSKFLIEESREFSDDRAIVWANNQIESYKTAMLYLVNSNKNWSMGVTADQESFIETMIRRAEA